MSNVQTVEDIYAAFGRGDVPAILEGLSESVDWEYGSTSTAVPWLIRRKGRDGAAAFFADLASMQILHDFQVKTILEVGQTVMALADIDFTVRATGKRVVEEDEAHIWRFGANGKVARFRHRVDTRKHQLACVK